MQLAQAQVQVPTSCWGNAQVKQMNAAFDGATPDRGTARMDAALLQKLRAASTEPRRGGTGAGKGQAQSKGVSHHAVDTGAAAGAQQQQTRLLNGSMPWQVGEAGQQVCASHCHACTVCYECSDISVGVSRL